MRILKEIVVGSGIATLFLGLGYLSWINETVRFMLKSAVICIICVGLMCFFVSLGVYCFRKVRNWVKCK